MRYVLLGKSLCNVRCARVFNPFPFPCYIRVSKITIYEYTAGWKINRIQGRNHYNDYVLYGKINRINFSCPAGGLVRIVLLFDFVKLDREYIINIM